MVLGGSGAARTVTVTPAANQSGTATITVTVSDGTLTASDTFLLTVTAVNDVPTISNIVDQAILQNAATGAIGVTVGDVETAAASLTLTGASSNPTLVPGANVVFGGSGAARTVTVTPAANQSGTATITVSVNDGTVSTSDTFVLTVTATNTAPTIGRYRGSDDERRHVDGRDRRDDWGRGDGAREPDGDARLVGHHAGAAGERRPGRQRRQPHGDGDAGGESVGHGDDHGDRERRDADGERHVPVDGDGGEQRADDLEHTQSDH